MGEAALEAFCDCGGAELRDDLVSVEEALARGLALATPVAGTETVPLAQAVGRVLAEDARASIPLPRFDAAAMDGYALRSAELTGEGPWRLRVVGRSPAGRKAAEGAGPGSAVRIFTGAPMPERFDAVVMQEHVRREGDRIVLEQALAPGRNVRFEGEDLALGATILPAGRRLDARGIAALAAAGIARPRVRRRLRVAVFRTGDEIREPGAPLGEAQIWDANGPMLAAALAQPWIETIPLGCVPDRAEAAAEALIGAAAQADLVISTGGASVGDEDHMPRALAAAGGEAHVMRVAMKPGKPFMLGRIGGAVYCGLPGAPFAAFVAWTVFGAAVAAKMAGRLDPVAPAAIARSAFALDRAPGRCEFRPARLVGHDDRGAPLVELTTPRFTHSLPALAGAEGLVLIPAEEERVRAGDLLRFLPLGG